MVLGLLTLLLSVVPDHPRPRAGLRRRRRGRGAFALVVLPAALVLFGRWIFWPKVPRVGQATLVDSRSLWRRVGDARRAPARPSSSSSPCCCSPRWPRGHASPHRARPGRPVPREAGGDRGGERLARVVPGRHRRPDRRRHPRRRRRRGRGRRRGRRRGRLGAPRRPAGRGVTELAVVLDVAPGVAGGRGGRRRDQGRGRHDLARHLRRGHRGAGARRRDRHRPRPAADPPADPRARPRGAGRACCARSWRRWSSWPPSSRRTSPRLGLSWWLFTQVLRLRAPRRRRPAARVPFLVALGVDYNIFLVTRAAEEAREHGTREGMLRALTATGGVITSAGILLAAVFAVLGVLPLVVLAQLGVVICVGVLLDTLVVRTVLVPAIAVVLGDRFWWPRRFAAPAESTTSRLTEPGPRHLLPTPRHTAAHGVRGTGEPRAVGRARGRLPQLPRYAVGLVLLVLLGAARSAGWPRPAPTSRASRRPANARCRTVPHHGGTGPRRDPPRVASVAKPVGRYLLVSAASRSTTTPRSPSPTCATSCGSRGRAASSVRCTGGDEVPARSAEVVPSSMLSSEDVDAQRHRPRADLPRGVPLPAGRLRALPRRGDRRHRHAHPAQEQHRPGRGVVRPRTRVPVHRPGRRVRPRRGGGAVSATGRRVPLPSRQGVLTTALVVAALASGRAVTR